MPFCRHVRAYVMHAPKLTFHTSMQASMPASTALSIVSMHGIVPV